jgi:hypothetical protein
MGTDTHGSNTQLPGVFESTYGVKKMSEITKELIAKELERNRTLRRLRLRMSADAMAEVEREDEYRRGYWDGFCEALDAIERGCPKRIYKRLAEFFDGALTDWRYGACDKYEQPPRLIRQPEGEKQ